MLVIKTWKLLVYKDLWVCNGKDILLVWEREGLLPTELDS
jgi:hypothetical protein